MCLYTFHSVFTCNIIWSSAQPYEEHKYHYPILQRQTWRLRKERALPKITLVKGSSGSRIQRHPSFNSTLLHVDHSFMMYVALEYINSWLNPSAMISAATHYTLTMYYIALRVSHTSQRLNKLNMESAQHKTWHIVIIPLTVNYF